MTTGKRSATGPWRIVGATLLLFAMAVMAVMVAMLASAQVPPVGEQIHVTVVTVPVQALDQRGRPVPSLRPADLIVREDGVEQTVVQVEAAGQVPPPGKKQRSSRAPEPAPARATAAASASKPWHILLYLDQEMLSYPTARDAVRDVIKHAQGLVALGPVEVVTADSELRQWLAPTRDAALLRRALQRLTRLGRGPGGLALLRRQASPGSGRAIGPQGHITGSLNQPNVALIRMQVGEEARFLERRRQLLLECLADRGRNPGEPRALLLLTGGYDLDPAERYLPWGLVPVSEMPTLSQLQADLRRFDQGPATERFAQAIAATGWVPIIAAGYDLQAPEVYGDASQSGAEKMTAFLKNGGGPSGPGLAGLARDNPLAPWRLVAAATGGQVVPYAWWLHAKVEALAKRFLVSYQVPRPADGRMHKLEIASRRPGITIRAPRWVGGGTPEDIAAARARSLLTSAAEQSAAAAAAAAVGPLQIAVTAHWSVAAGKPAKTLHGKFLVRVAFHYPPEPKGSAAAPGRAPRRHTLRFTVAIPRSGGGAYVDQAYARDVRVEDLRGFFYQAEVAADPGTSRMAVVVEDLETGAWAGAVAPFTMPNVEKPSGPN